MAATTMKPAPEQKDQFSQWCKTSFARLLFLLEQRPAMHATPASGRPWQDHAALAHPSRQFIAIEG
jgi:hypothetical protein